MITQLFRITHQDGENYHLALSGSLKDSSVNQEYTDLDFYCAGGKKISCHKALILRFPSSLANLIQKQTCCECLGDECKRGQDTIGISLADVQAATMKGLLELLYTGSTKLIKKAQDANEILDLANKMLGMRIPKSQLSLETFSNGGDSLSTIDFRRVKVPPASRQGPLNYEMTDVVLLSEEGIDPTSPEARLVPTKRLRLDSEISTDNEFDLEGIGKRKCPKCSKPYSIKWMTRHVNSCTGEILDEINAEEPADSSYFKEDCSDSETKKCPKCNRHFKIKGGWITRHVRMCSENLKLSERRPQSIEKTGEQIKIIFRKESQPIEPAQSVQSLSHEDRSPCPKCGEFFQNRGGVFFKHINQCNVVVNEVKTISGAISCKKCGKVYPPSKKRYLIKHEELCIGLEPSIMDSSVSRNLTNEEEKTTQIFAVDPDEALALYNQQNWKCFLCGSVCSKRDGLKAHLVLHFRSKLEAEEPSTYQSLRCSRCKYLGSDKPILFIHIALTHQVLRKYIPSCLHDILFSKHTIESAKHSKTNDETKLIPSDAGPYKQKPIPPPQNIGESIEKRPESFSGHNEEKVWTCFLCDEVFKVKNQFKYHIIKHYRSDLKKFLNETSPTICTVCGVNCANFDTALSHVSWTHQKIKEILTPEQGSYLFGSDVTSAKVQSATSVPAKSPEVLKVVQEKYYTGSLMCTFCGSVYSRRTELKNCLLTHVKMDVEKKYVPNETTRECSFCNYKAGSKDHLLTHLCLTHRKICDFLTPEYSDMVFGRKRGITDSEVIETGQKSGSQANTQLPDLQVSDTGKIEGGVPLLQETLCCVCDTIFPTETDFQNHAVSCCCFACNRCKEPFKDAATLRSHETLCNSTAVSLKCHLCVKNTFDHPHHFKAHYTTHLKKELLDLVSSELTDETGLYRCSNCEFMTNKKDSLSLHVGYKHALFLRFLPSEVSERLKGFFETKGNTLKISNGESLTNEERHRCQRCKKRFTSQTSLMNHINVGNCKSMKSKSGDVKCIMCEEVVQTFLQYKCHLFLHYEESIAREWGSKYEKDKGKCLECGSCDTFVEGEKLTDDVKSAFVRHMAIDHDKIFTYLTPETREDMRTAFSDGRIALPSSPSPQTENLVETIEVEHFDDSGEDFEIQIEAVDDIVKTDTDQ